MLKLIETLCESNINNFVEEHFSSENIYILVLLPMKWWIPSNDSQIVGLTEVMEEILPQVPKLSGSPMNKTHEDQTVFLQKKHTLEKLYKVNN